MRVVQLMASPFFGGPERQMLGLARNLPPHVRTAFLTFPERGLAQPLLEQVRRHGFEGVTLRHNFPYLRRSAAEIAGHLRRLRADVLCCSGYKPDIIGWLAARRVGVPVVSISHGWTAATWKVRLNEAVNKLVNRWMDAVVCVSAGQAVKVRRAGVAPERTVVIRNAVGPEAFAEPDADCRRLLASWFATPPRLVVGAAGRLSPEKGFEKFIDAAALIAARRQDVGFVIFGDGPLREALTRQIAERGLHGRFLLAGFRTDLQRFLPQLDVAVLSSYTEGLPVAVLEAMAAAVPVVATAVGGTPEVIDEGKTGFLVPAGDAAALANRIGELLDDEPRRRAMGAAGRRHVAEHFSFATQAGQYLALFERLMGRQCVAGRALAGAGCV
jgi:glycosyltransferase involved in cell wall biosynthesis